MKFGTNITSLEANPYMYHMAVMQTCEVGATLGSQNIGSEVFYGNKSLKSMQLSLRYFI